MQYLSDLVDKDEFDTLFDTVRDVLVDIGSTSGGYDKF